MAKAISGHSVLKSAMAMAIVAIPVVPPLFLHGSSPKKTQNTHEFQPKQQWSGYGKKWLSAYKIRNVSETTEDRVKVTINCL